MKKLPYLLALSGVISASAMAADAPASPHTISYNVGITTDYIFRGVSQSQHDPAISGGIDYS
ncbi:MAG TPA: TorF family putative porin, partial [Thiobacillaceae bacterium]|nr:TorF family putative porin [Thiobacillaceae bacterium]